MPTSNFEEVRKIKEYKVTAEKGLFNEKPKQITLQVTANNPQAAKFRAMAEIYDNTPCGGEAKIAWLYAISVTELPQNQEER